MIYILAFITHHPFISLLIFFSSLVIIPEVIEGIWVKYFQKKWRAKKCLKNNHNWSEDYDMTDKERKDIYSLLNSAAQNKTNPFCGLAELFVNNINKGGYELKNHKCHWCNKETWTITYNWDKLNIEETRDKKIDEILNG
jgi:hypothetical protein